MVVDRTKFEERRRYKEGIEFMKDFAKVGIRIFSIKILVGMFLGQKMN